MIAHHRFGACGRTVAACLAALSGLVPGGAQVAAKVPQISVVPLSDLRFGDLVVFGSGSRTVTATGNVFDSGIMPGASGDVGPARFTIAYDRGNESKRPLNLVIELVLSDPRPLDVSGISARLGSFESDLAGISQIQPGRPFTVTMRNCSVRVCSVTFALGGKLDLTRNFGGADLRFPLSMDAFVLSEN